MPDLCLEIDFYSREQLTALLETIGERNPAGVWTRRVDRMGNVPCAEIYSLDGVPIFEIVERDTHRGWNDLRPGKQGDPLTLTVPA